MKYLDGKGREAFVSMGISRPPNETWGVYRRKPSGSLQRIKSAPTAFNNTDNEIGGIPVSSSGTWTTNYTTIEDIRDACEVLADDCRALRETVSSYKTLISEMRRVLIANGLMKGSA